MPSNFDFVRAGWPKITEEAMRAEHTTYADPRASLFHSRLTVEFAVHWLYEADATLREPYKRDLAALLFESTFKQLVGPKIATKMDLIRRLGNSAVHGKPVNNADSLAVVHELFQVLLWLAIHYSLDPNGRPDAESRFNDDTIPKPTPGAASKTLEQLRKLADEVVAKEAALAEANLRTDVVTAQLEALQRETLQRDVAIAKAQNAIVPDTHDYRENETRDRFIDVLLREAGWALDQPRDLEYPVVGMPNNSDGGDGLGGTGFVDYVLWGEDGMPLGLVEAKRTRKDAGVGQHQAKLYADALEAMFHQRPVIFYTNGYEHWIWDDVNYPPRQVQGFYTRDELALVIQRRTTRKPLASLAISFAIADRHYQQRAVRKVSEAFENKERRALLVMATGSGKTRTVIALSDLLMRANWAKRILFLADRIALVNQATNAFKSLLPDSPPVNLSKEDGEGRVYLATYPKMMGLIDAGGGAAGGSGGGASAGTDEFRRFGPGYFDLIVVDEAHRSVYQKYGEIFGYFDALLVGLTATPKDEIDHNTYGLFNLEDGVPTDSYDLTDAIAEGYLVPPVARSVATQFVRDGIRYADLSEAEKEQWDLLDWADDVVPDQVDRSAMNTWLFNADTVDKVLEALMTEGRRVAGGDKLGKTIIFAKNTKHAQFIEERFNANYPEFAGHFASIITYQISYAQNLIDDFSNPERLPQIAISVDMLDTGIDVPDVVNLVFFKPVHSKTKYWQMIGRGTRLRPDVYGPGADKQDFVIFDVCQNIEYFNQELPADAGSVTESLGQRLFKARLSLLAGIDGAGVGSRGVGGAGLTHPELIALREGLAARMHGQVSGMSLDNFLVRPRRRLVERFAESAKWLDMTGDDYARAAELSNLPSSVDVLDTDEQAKRFDLFALRTQLGVLVGDPGFTAAKARIQAIANALAEQKNIPKIAVNLELISAVASEEWWQDVSVSMLEMMRVRMRELVALIDPVDRAIVYTNFADTAEESVPIEIKDVAIGVDRARFREKAMAFLRAHEDDVVLFKLRHGHRLTALDLTELERIMAEAGGFSPSEISAAASEAKGLGLFVRSLVGMDRAAVTQQLSAFTEGSVLTGNQLVFVNLIVEQLTQRGFVDPALLYSAPFTDVAPTGPEGIFNGAQLTDLLTILERVTASANAS